MLKRFLTLFKGEYRTLNKIEISTIDLLDNYKYLSSLNSKLKIAPVVKSNGYGHGIKIISNIIDQVNAPFICVDSLYEGYELLKNNLKTPILIMGYTDQQNLKAKNLPFSFAIYSLETIKALNTFQRNFKIHIFVDTGMRREGVSIEELPILLDQAKRMHNIKIEGVMSHLASSEGKNDKIFLNQIMNFKKVKLILKKYRVQPRWVHIGASGSIINPQVRSMIVNISNTARAGLAMYGYPATKNNNLKPILTLQTKLVQIKKIKKGDQVGYDGTYTAKKDMSLGILPIGYYDGVDRGLSNKGVVSINGVNCKIIGRVSMNITTIDLTNIKEPKLGQSVCIYSKNPKDENSIEKAAKICHKIPYEILVNFAASTKRYVH